ncbi:hypothetical protein BT63DRAFT_7710 [Microthyrium microscopicum]|uniref:Uncharacterized protein n=1 Tax=Microthyrium microscopicum TaxID=703497 RepID=A0A6A6USF7_9PEZI|nr:hypothetical protein BT63DRAFT_7710 [Microthyrium microscopicum]
MDSMRGLRGSLPLASSRRNELLQPFRDTACALTTLYKDASAEVDRAYSTGAKEALEELLAEMDRENLGLQEGEGWRVRQLVMQLYQGLEGTEKSESGNNASVEKKAQEDVSPRGSSSPIPMPPITEPTTTREQQSRSLDTEPVDARQQSPPAPKSVASTSGSLIHPIFTFTAPHPTLPVVDNTHQNHLPPANTYSTSTPNREIPFMFEASTKLPAKPKVAGHLGPGAGAKRRHLPHSDHHSRASPPGRESAKRTRHNSSDT